MLIFWAIAMCAVVPEVFAENARIKSQKSGFFIGVRLFSAVMNISAFINPQTSASAKKKPQRVVFSTELHFILYGP